MHMKTKPRKIQLYLAIAAISFVQGLQLSISPVLGSISAHYSTVDISLVQMLITIPAFVSMLSSLLCGVLVLKMSKKKMLLISCAVAGVAGLLPLAADSFALLFAARAVYGIALGWCTSLNAAVVSEFFEGEEQVAAMGVQAASVGAGMTLLSALSGILGKNGFRGSYFTNLAAFLCFAVILLCLPDTGVEKETENEKVRINGKVLLLSSVGFGVYVADDYPAEPVAIEAAGQAEQGKGILVFHPDEPVAGLIFYPGGKVACHSVRTALWFWR